MSLILKIYNLIKNQSNKYQLTYARKYRRKNINLTRFRITIKTSSSFTCEHKTFLSLKSLRVKHIYYSGSDDGSGDDQNGNISLISKIIDENFFSWD